MTRVEQLKSASENANKRGGMAVNEWMLLYLAHIAYSVAIIADALTEKDGEV